MANDQTRTERPETAPEQRKLSPDEVAPGVTKKEFEERYPEDPANQPGWDEYVEEFFDREVFPGEKVRKATDALKE